MLMMTCAGCVKEQVAEKPVLDALKQPIEALVVAVVKDGGPQSRSAARQVAAIYDAGTSGAK